MLSKNWHGRPRRCTELHQQPTFPVHPKRHGPHAPGNAHGPCSTGIGKQEHLVGVDNLPAKYNLVLSQKMNAQIRSATGTNFYRRNHVFVLIDDSLPGNETIKGVLDHQPVTALAKTFLHNHSPYPRRSVFVLIIDSM